MQVKEKFNEIFSGDADTILVKAPGRVNLIGEHIDYQGGNVLPIAVDKYIWSYGRKKNNGKIKIYSVNYKESCEILVSKISYQKEKHWANYVLGVIEEFRKLHFEISGLEIAVGGDIPVGSGLSSSAAVEISVATLIQKIFHFNLSPVEIIKLARRAENEFVGVNCGIMDQFSSYLCKKEYALLLNCKSLSYQYIPLNLGEYNIFLVDTKKERALSSSSYNERFNQVKRVLEIIQNKYPGVEYLAEVREEKLKEFKNRIDAVSYKRTLHIIKENKRVLKFAELLKKGESKKLGNLLYQSHESLKNLYEVSCEELDFIVDFCRDFSGIAGARLTGAGFGGCCLVLIKNEKIDEFIEKLSPAYNEKFHRLPAFYKINSTNGSFL